MGGFVTVYNYAGFRLLEPPFGLGQATVSLIFVTYLLGTASSAWVGHLAGRLGRRRVLWITILVMAAGLNAAAFHARGGLRKADRVARAQTAAAGSSVCLCCSLERSSQRMNIA